MDDWHGCYDDGWKGLIVDEAFAHPAKIARGLSRRIYTHAFEQGWLRAGDCVVDPFGGIAGTAYYAAHMGLRWVGCELEPRFHALAGENFKLWAHLSRHHADYVPPVMVCGDSRKLAELVGAAGCVVSSPPFSQAGCQPPAIRSHAPVRSKWIEEPDRPDNYGDTPGQLGRLREGDVAAVVSSPPFEKGAEGGLRGSKFKDPAAFAAAMSAADGKNGRHAASPAARLAQLWRDSNRVYGDTNGNIGNDTGETFWSAAREIVEQCWHVLRPGGHAIWVVKDYVKAGRIVPFCANWRLLCESVGFRTLCEHRAMLVKDLGEEHSLFEAPKRRTKERKSFFRRLAEKKGSPRIDWETVICMERLDGSEDEE